jgi:hypothetical protein
MTEELDDLPVAPAEDQLQTHDRDRVRDPDNCVGQ